MSTKPITPSDIASSRLQTIPPEVIEAFNEEIAKRATSGGQRAVILQKNVLERILSKLPETPRSEIFSNCWLDVEPIFEKAGWTVSYDKPGYCESYSANWTFRWKGEV